MDAETLVRTATALQVVTVPLGVVALVIAVVAYAAGKRLEVTREEEHAR